MKRITTVLPPELGLTGPDWARVSHGAEDLGAWCACVKVTFTRQSLPGVEPKVFQYKIEAVDGRIWRQDITFDNLRDPLMTFNVNDTWRLSEFSRQRDLRDALVAMVGTYPTLEKVTFDYAG